MAVSISVSPSPSRQPSSSSNRNRPPTLSFPALHLGSFDALSIQPPHHPTQVPGQASPTSPLSQTQSQSSGAPRHGVRAEDADNQNSASGFSPSRAGLPRAQSESSNGGVNRLSIRPSSASSTSSRSSFRHRGSIPPPLPPPTMSLPPLPSVSPISPFGPISPIRQQGVPSPSTMPRLVSSSSSQSFSGASRDLPTVPTRPRPLGHSLTIHIPGPLTPSLSDKDGLGLPSPILRNSPGVARRRTIIEGTQGHQPSPVRLSDTIDAMTPPRDASPEQPERKSSIQAGSISMPEPQPTPAVEQKSFVESPRRLEKKVSTGELKDASPVSPTAKRSLPRPPRVDEKPSNPDLRQTAQSQQSVQLQSTAGFSHGPLPKPPLHTGSTPAVINAKQQPPSAALTSPSPPAPSSSWPPLNVTRSPQPAPPAPQDANSLRPAFYQRHQANNSASSLPVIAGLADAGPYPSTPAAPPGRLGAQPAPSPIGIGRPNGQPNGAGPSRAPITKPQEEICLECMMRDRDLADVIVQGEGVWERGSDVDWRDMRWREEALLKALSKVNAIESVSSGLSRSFDDEESSDSESTSISPPSTGYSLEDLQARRRQEERKKRRSVIQARRRQTDAKIVSEVGWRGFKWEEGAAGEGLPRGFKGTRPGRLTEEGIKAIMTKFPSASAHRYQWLQGYLRNQWLLVLDVRAEAQRLGHFPFPDEIDASTSTVSSHEGRSIPPGAQPSALSWETRPIREISEQPRGFIASRGTPGLSIVRPSPSSPAGLAALAGQQRPPPLQRPLTHYLPDREPSLAPPRTPVRTSPSSMAKSRHGKKASSPGALEQASIRSAAYNNDNEELWSPSEGAGLRPFSFAVRAGATAAREGSESGHGRRSLWGRWGGSVTSFFGGSQNGSGSMMDMHLGLDNDRRRRTSSISVNPYPRAVSMASPTRPSFFDRESRSSVNLDHEPRISRAISHSRLSQFHLNDEDEDDQPKKKGFKGFLKKMKPKAGKTKLTKGDPLREDRQKENLQPQVDQNALAPPPSISYLVSRGEKKHNRNRSGSSSSMLTDSQASVGPGPNANRYSGSGSLPYGLRSVSAPVQDSSSGGSQSNSPTSSKYTSNQARRESYASASGRSGRRRSGTMNDLAELADEADHREVLANSGRGFYSSPEPTAIFEEQHRYRAVQGRDHSHLPQHQQQHHGPSYPHHNFRPHNKTTSSLSASSGTLAIETPPPTTFVSSTFFNGQNPGQQKTSHFQQQQQQSHVDTNANGPIIRSPSGQLSPNRFKNLPPLPPNDGLGHVLAASPDSFAAAFPDQDFSLAGTVHDPKYLSEQRSGRQAVATGYGYPQPGQKHGYAHPASGRTSLDQRPRVPNPASNGGRAVQTMYVQPSTTTITKPHGGFGPSTIGQSSGQGFEEGEKKKKGLRGIFGGSKAGRMA